VGMHDIGAARGAPGPARRRTPMVVGDLLVGSPPRRCRPWACPGRPRPGHSAQGPPSAVDERSELRRTDLPGVPLNGAFPARRITKSDRNGDAMRDAWLPWGITCGITCGVNWGIALERHPLRRTKTQVNRATEGSTGIPGSLGHKQEDTSAARSCNSLSCAWSPFFRSRLHRHSSLALFPLILCKGSGSGFVSCGSSALFFPARGWEMARFLSWRIASPSEVESRESSLVVGLAGRWVAGRNRVRKRVLK
jgi:hypothetical protein